MASKLEFRRGERASFPPIDIFASNEFLLACKSLLVEANQGTQSVGSDRVLEPIARFLAHPLGVEISAAR